MHRRVAAGVVAAFVCVGVCGIADAAHGSPGTVLVQAEDFTDQGGGQVRVSDVPGQDPFGPARVFRNWDNAGHWLEWKVEVLAGGRYRLALRYATSLEQVQRRVELDGAPVPGLEQVMLPGTGGWDAWRERLLSPVFTVEAGSHNLRMTNLTANGSANLDYFKLVSAEGEKLLLGFERDELEAMFVQKLGSGAIQETGQRFRLVRKEGDQWRMYPAFDCRPVSPTQGEFSAHHWVSSAVQSPATMGGNRLQGFELPEWEAWYYRPAPANLMVVNTFHWWRASGRPSGRQAAEAPGPAPGEGAEAFPTDWSGYDVLRFDVTAVNDWGTAGLVLRFAVEDEEIEPPATCFFDVPDRQAVTLEVPLAELAKERGLDLTDIVDWWIAVERAAGATHVYVDNVRLASREAPLVLPAVAPRESPAYAPAPSKPRPPALARDVTPDRTPVELGEPIVVVPPGEDVVSFRPSGWITAYDDQRMLLAFTGFRGREHVWNVYAPLVAMQTTDGGKTWTGVGGGGSASFDLLAPDAEVHSTTSRDPRIAGQESRRLPTLLWNQVWLNLDHGSGCGEAVDADGDCFFMTSAGCSGPAVSGPRLFLEKTEFVGSAGWRVRAEKALLSSDIRHCGSSFSCLRLASGRLWAAMGQTSRLGANVHARFSDDDGQTWHSWQEVAGKTSGVPGSEGDYRGAHQYASKHVTLTRFGDHVACFWQDMAGLKWSRFDGAKWSPVEVVAAEAAGTRNTDQVFAVTRGREEVFVTAPKVPGVLRWTGEGWAKELPDAAANGRLSLAGDVVMLFTIEGIEGEVPQGWPITQPGGKTIACYAKPAGGDWTARQELVREEVPFTTYRAMESVVVPRDAPPNFVPLAWTGLKQTYIKLLRVPVPTAVGAGLQTRPDGTEGSKDPSLRANRR